MTNSTKRSSKIGLVPLIQMTVNPNAQRRFNQAWGDEILTNFDIDKMRRPIVSYRNNHYYIVDGQHTVYAVKGFIGKGWESQKLECEVFTDLDEKGEADLFIDFNNRKNVCTFDKFVTEVSANRPEAVGIHNTVKSCGLTISRSRKDTDNAISAVASMRKIYRNFGAKTLHRSLVILRDSLGSSGYEGALIEGVGNVCNRYNGALDDTVAVEAIKGIHGGASALLSEAQSARHSMGGSLPQNVALTLVSRINKKNVRRKKKPLPKWRNETTETTHGT